MSTATAAANPAQADHTATRVQPAVTRLLAEWISATGDAAITPAALEWARHVLLDWSAVALAGAGEPLVQMLVAEYVDGGPYPCTVLAGAGRARPHDAALINGAAGHALDYDDVASRMFGHPSVPVVPAALAMAQAHDLPGRALLRAIVVGHEVESRIGEMVGPAHYLHGFHATGTVGTFGAAAACANLLGLDADRTAQALGLAATQAAGLKCMFGTMAKPLHAGKAAMNGLMAARLAARGFTAHGGAIETAQGFAATQAPTLSAFTVPIDSTAGFAIEASLFKYHAACYLTHSTIEAIRALRTRERLTLDDLESMTITVAGNHRGVCDIEDPKDGLNVKFSIKHLAALALDGADTAALALYSEPVALAPAYAAARRRTRLVFGNHPNRNLATVLLHTRDGRCFEQSADVAIPATDLPAQWARLAGKAAAIANPVIGAERFDRLTAAIRGLDQAATLEPLIEALQ